MSERNKVNGPVRPQMERCRVLFCPVLTAAGLVLTGLGFFSGCYTLKQGAVMLGYLGRAEPLENLPDSGSPEPGEREKNRIFVERVHDIRRFAVGELGLRESQNYTRYVRLDRSYLAAVVSASAKDSFTRYEWWFPVVGAVPYKGFFDPEDAGREKARLERKGLDVWVRGVDAFSTLGWFRDPLYSYMRDYPPERLADLIIHELVHATVFIRGQVQFNEELAEFIGREGARLYMESRFGAESEEYRRMENAGADSAAFLAFIQGLIVELEDLYQSGSARETVLEEKERIVSAAMRRFDDEYETRFRSDDYRGFSRVPVNNAYLELYRLYYAGDMFFDRMYERYGRNLPVFAAAARSLNGSGPARRDPRGEFERALEIRAGAGKP